MVMLVLEQDPVPPRMLNPKADRDLEMICLRCLQKPIDLRYASAAALADDLEAYLNDESISARSGRFAQILAGLMRETHHAAVLENWGLLWMWHSLALIGACFATNILQLWGYNDRLYYFLLWTAGLMAAFPRYAHFLFGIVSAACFFFPGLKYYRQRLRAIVAALRGNP